MPSDHHRSIHLQVDGISFGFQRSGILPPGEGRHSGQDCEAVLLDACYVFLEPVLRAFPVPQAVDLLGGLFGSDADKMVAIQAVVHIDSVAVEIEVRDSGLAVCMKRDDVLGL